MNLNKLAHGISWVFHPFLLPLYMIILLLTFTAFKTYPFALKCYLMWVVVLYTILIPILSLVLLRKMGYVSDYRIDIRRERILPLLVGIISYLLCALTISKLPSVLLFRKFMIAATACELLALVVSTRWKISLHLTGMGAFTSILILMNVVTNSTLFIPLIFSIGASGLLASSRLYLGCHTGLQVFTGYCSGLLIAFISMMYL